MHDNHVRTFEILSIQIFDLKIDGQGHEEQLDVLRHYAANCVAYNFVKKFGSIFN